MQATLTLSLPQQTVEVIKQKTKEKGFNSVSRYIKYLLNLDEDLIPEDELMCSIEQARKNYRQSKTIKANSLVELL